MNFIRYELLLTIVFPYEPHVYELWSGKRAHVSKGHEKIVYALLGDYESLAGVTSY